MRLGAILALAGAAAVARGDGLPQAGLPDAQAVNLRSPLEALPTVDRVVVHKSERRLVLMHGGNVVRAYHVQLGLNPGRAEGALGRLPHPGGHLPARRGATRAATTSCRSRCPIPTPGTCGGRTSGTGTPGGSIMIHGLPNQPQPRPDYYESHDWTDGCIAVSNADMVEIWMLTPDDVPIEILP